MSKLKALTVDKRNKVNGLYTYCSKCERIIENRVCTKTGKRLSTCKNTDKHAFKAIVSVPGTNGTKRKTRVFKTRDHKRAIELKIEFERELESNSFQSVNAHLMKEKAKPSLLIECMAMYVGYQNNVDVAAHKVKVRTQKHIKEIEYFFGLLCKALIKNGINHTIFKVTELNDNVVAMFHSYLLEDREYANKTYNKIIAQHRQFLNWLILDRGYVMENPFIGVQRRKVISNKSVVTSKEFDKLLSVITPENGFQHYANGLKRNRYKSWMKDALRLALETGLRREEFMSLKFSNILYDENNQPQFFEVENFKVNRIKGLNTEEGQKKLIPITEGLMNLLYSIGYSEYSESDRFLIGHEEESSRKTLTDFVSKAFTHFWKLTKIDKNVQLKHLRKTYLTALVQQFGDKAPIISDHSGMEVLKKHYVNDKQLIAASQSFTVF